MILRKFKNIAGNRYEEIAKAYREFLLTKEELSIPNVNSILLPLDRYVKKVPEGVYEILSAYPHAEVEVVYVIDGEICRLIEETIGKEEAKLFREREEETGRRLLESVGWALSRLGLIGRTRLLFGSKSEVVEEISENFDLIVLSRHYGAETTKTHPVSTVVLRIMQNVSKPVILY
ncbi:hypothetical protein PYCH_13310 [Pyrococcus yayanosii CH1]|uniref:UspA domain-containing protein n=1 Tax=Pyrococcus yayanosii (strain CH1 / JCM 16557) TaxID=529709 RepID=F8AJE6_PYRYC|nr:hypothetical protein PYCH_13310 [Pyrococcus yayanosii CH1]